MPTEIFIVGCGYVGQRIAKYYLNQRFPVIALTRNNTQYLQQLGIRTIVGNLDYSETLKNLPIQRDTLIFYCAPPPNLGIIDPRLKHFLNTITQATEKFILISTTSVYGDCQGAWITEDRFLNPQTNRAKRRVNAENILKNSELNYTILRVAGIYGAEQLPTERLEKGIPVLKESQSPFSNRIYVDDLIEVCVLAAEKAPAQSIYHVSDGNPTTMTDYFNQVADALNLPRPPEIDQETAKNQLSPEMRSYLAESKRLNIQKVRSELGFSPRYPDLKTGLKACLQ
jgi:nucleoside-diphosphate-sugar epimerase